MKNHTISSENGKRLILFFAGWGMDTDMFAGMRRAGYDIMVVYDYTAPDFDTAAVERYEEIVILAWSMGVYFADRFIRECKLRNTVITKCVAVNGTLSPIHDKLGIPPSIYELTCALPNANAVNKFCRRICGRTAAMNRLMPKEPSRTVDELRNELIAIRKVVDSHPLHLTDASLWDEILISTRDLIFPPANMMRAWENAADRITLLQDAAHIIDFGEAAERLFIDKSLVGMRFGAALPTYDADAGVQRKVASRLAGIIERIQIERSALDILEIGSGSGILTRMYEPMFNNSHISFVDLAPGVYPSSNGNTHSAFACDAETMLAKAASNSFDVVISSSSIQWLNSPRRFISDTIRCLRCGGHAYISFFAKGTLGSIAEIATLRYPSIGKEFIEESGCRCETDEETITLDFNSPQSALRHLKRTGVNSLRRTPISVGQTREILRRLSNSDGSATLSFRAVYLIISKP